MKDHDPDRGIGNRRDVAIADRCGRNHRKIKIRQEFLEAELGRVSVTDARIGAIGDLWPDATEAEAFGLIFGEIGLIFGEKWLIIDETAGEIRTVAVVYIVIDAG